MGSLIPSSTRGQGQSRSAGRFCDDPHDQVAELGHVTAEDAEHLVLGNPLALLHTRVGVGDQGQRRVAQRQFPGQHGLRMAGHPDQRPALGGEPLRLGPGGEPRPLDDHQRPRVGQLPARGAGGRDGLGPADRAVRVGERHVHRAARLVERLDAA